MEKQLELLDSRMVGTWRLDDQTRRIGMAGIAQARAALRQIAAIDVPEEPESVAGEDTPKAA